MTKFLACVQNLFGEHHPVRPALVIIIIINITVLLFFTLLLLLLLLLLYHVLGGETLPSTSSVRLSVHTYVHHMSSFVRTIAVFFRPLSPKSLLRCWQQCLYAEFQLVLFFKKVQLSKQKAIKFDDYYIADQNRLFERREEQRLRTCRLFLQAVLYTNKFVIDIHITTFIFTKYCEIIFQSCISQTVYLEKSRNDLIETRTYRRYSKKMTICLVYKSRAHLVPKYIEDLLQFAKMSITS